MKTCSICGGREVARGWCGLHYGRWQRTGDPNLIRRTPTTDETGAKRVCYVSGCTDVVRNKGLCRTHYSRLRCRGTTDYVGKPNEGATRHPMYSAWKRALRRGCAEEWRSLERFAQDVGERPHYMAHLKQPDRSRPLGPGNWAWSKRVAKTREAGVWKREASRLYHLKNARSMRDKTLQLRFGITLDQYNEMLAAQNGGCAICGDPPTERRALAVDHCHATGRVRALLCVKCNVSLGGFRDDPVLLRAALSYLEKHSVKPPGMGPLPTLRVQEGY